MNPNKLCPWLSFLSQINSEATSGSFPRSSFIALANKFHSLSPSLASFFPLDPAAFIVCWLDADTLRGRALVSILWQQWFWHCKRLHCRVLLRFFQTSHYGLTGHKHWHTHPHIQTRTKFKAEELQASHLLLSLRRDQTKIQVTVANCLWAKKTINAHVIPITEHC